MPIQKLPAFAGSESVSRLFTQVAMLQAWLYASAHTVVLKGGRMRENSFWNLWPEIDNHTAAIKASRQGVLVASISCIFTTFIALITLVVSAPGFSLYSLVDAVVFGIIA